VSVSSSFTDQADGARAEVINSRDDQQLDDDDDDDDVANR